MKDDQRNFFNNSCLGDQMERAVEYLRNLDQDWWNSKAAVLAVAGILDDFGSFESTNDVVSFFLEPQKWCNEVSAIVTDVNILENA